MRWSIWGRVGVGMESVSWIITLKGGCGEVVGQDICGGPFYLGIVGVSSVSFMDMEDFSGGILVIIKDLS